MWPQLVVIIFHLQTKAISLQILTAVINIQFQINILFSIFSALSLDIIRKKMIMRSRMKRKAERESAKNERKEMNEARE